MEEWFECAIHLRHSWRDPIWLSNLASVDPDIWRFLLERGSLACCSRIYSPRKEGPEVHWSPQTVPATDETAAELTCPI